MKPQNGTFEISPLSLSVSTSEISYSKVQKQPYTGVLRKRCSENMQQIYKRTPMLECDSLVLSISFKKYQSYMPSIYFSLSPPLILHNRIRRVLKDFFAYFTLSWRRPLLCRNHSIDLLWKSVYCFLYDRDLRHERVNDFSTPIFGPNSICD